MTPTVTQSRRRPAVSVSRLPPQVLSAVFGVPADTFNKFKKVDAAITILRSP
jgi:oxalate decarboxylase